MKDPRKRKKDLRIEPDPAPLLRAHKLLAKRSDVRAAVARHLGSVSSKYWHEWESDVPKRWKEILCRCIANPLGPTSSSYSGNVAIRKMAYVVLSLNPRSIPKALAPNVYASANLGAALFLLAPTAGDSPAFVEDAVETLLSAASTADPSLHWAMLQFLSWRHSNMRGSRVVMTAAIAGLACRLSGSLVTAAQRVAESDAAETNMSVVVNLRNRVESSFLNLLRTSLNVQPPLRAVEFFLGDADEIPRSRK